MISNIMSRNNILDFPGHCRTSLSSRDYSHDPLNAIDSVVNIIFNEDAVTDNYVFIQQFKDIQMTIKSLSFINANSRSTI